MQRAIWLLAPFLAGACHQTLPPQALTAVDCPAVLRSGSPILLRGVSLGGAEVEVRSSAGNATVAIAAVAASADGAESAQVELPDVAWSEGAAVRHVCLIADGFSDWRTCLDVSARFTRTVTAGPAQLESGRGSLGATVAVQSQDLLLPGEGQAVLEIATGASDATHVSEVALTTALATGRGHGAIRVAPSWLGVQPGRHEVRVRLVQRTGAASATGPWSANMPFELDAPTLTLLEDGGLTRGGQLPVAVRGVPTSWQLLASGVLRGADGAVAATFPAESPLALPTAFLAGRPIAWAPSPWFFKMLAPLIVNNGVGMRLEGDIRLALTSTTQTWIGAPVAVQWPLLPTVQIVVLEMGDSLHAGAVRFGLECFTKELRQRVLTLCAAHFAGLAVHVTSSPPAAQIEVLRLAILDRDPNDLDLLGADSSAGKDDGNLTLDEHLGGYDAGSASAGAVAYGGVFMGSFLGFSASLHPGAAASDTAFDALFSPYARALGGRPALPSQHPSAAIEALAQLIAHSATHEIGHALGLAAATSDFHHAGDHPGWIMDAGPARPFSERAALPGAVAQTWGPVDAAYLRAILPADP